MNAGCMVDGCLIMEDIIDARIHETSLQMQVAHYRSHEFCKPFCRSVQAKRENFPLLNNELPCQVIDGKPNVPHMTGVDQHTQIGVLNI